MKRAPSDSTASRAQHDPGPALAECHNLVLPLRREQESHRNFINYEKSGYEGDKSHWKQSWLKLVKRYTCLEGGDYAKYLRESKVVLCPWGLGERTSCEHGGWVHGALVVKPFTDFVLSVPDRYRSSETYVAAWH